MDGWIANLYKMLGLEKEKATAAQKPLSPDASQEEKVSSDGASEQTFVESIERYEVTSSLTAKAAE